MRMLKTWCRIAFLAAASAVVIFPLYWLVASSLKTRAELFAFPPLLFLSKVDFSGYGEMLRETELVRIFANSFVVTLSTVAISLVMATLAAYSLSRFRFVGKELLGLLTLLTYLFPPVVLLVPMYVLYARTGLLDSHLGLIIAFTTFNVPFALWLLRAYLASIPTELDEAARIDGASWIVVLWRVILPLAKPGLATAAIFTFINSWNEFMYTSIFINDPQKMTLPYAIYSFMSGQLVRWKPLLAAGVMVTLPIFLVFVVFQKAFIRGLTSGAVKG